MIEWLGHASVKIKASKTIYIDPWKLKSGTDKADIILCTHGHHDHLSPDDIERVRKFGTVIVVPKDEVGKVGGEVKGVKPGDHIAIGSVKIEVLPAYNIDKQYHPRQQGHCGYVIEMDGKRYYHAGDTDSIPEMQQLKKIDYAFLPIGGTYTMNAEEAAKAANTFKPAVAVPIHWGDLVGTRQDAEKFKMLVRGTVEILNH